MRFVAASLLAFIAMMFLTFAATTRTDARRDPMLNTSKYVRLRLFREDGAAQFRAVNAAAIDSCAILLRDELAMVGNHPE